MLQINNTATAGAVTAPAVAVLLQNLDARMCYSLSARAERLETVPRAALMKNILMLTGNIDEAVSCLIADSIDQTAAIARQEARAGCYTPLL
jgi:hypothetical protein